MTGNTFYDPSNIPNVIPDGRRLVIPGVTEILQGNQPSGSVINASGGGGNPINTISKVLWLKPEGVRVSYDSTANKFTVFEWVDESGVALTNEDVSENSVHLVSLGDNLQAVQFDVTHSGARLCGNVDLGLQGKNTFLFYALLYRSLTDKSSLFYINNLDFNWIQGQNHSLEFDLLNTSGSSNDKLTLKIPDNEEETQNQWNILKVRYHFHQGYLKYGDAEVTDSLDNPQGGGFSTDSFIYFPNGGTSSETPREQWLGEFLATTDLSSEEILDGYFNDLLTKYRASTVQLA